MNLNKVIICGRVTQDIEVRTTPTGQSVASFSVATNRNWTDQAGKKQEQVEFHNVVLWRRLAEVAGQYLKKGALVMIEGRLQTRNWQGQDGVKKYRTEILGENMQMGPRAGGASGGNYNPSSAVNPASYPEVPAQNFSSNNSTVAEPTATIQLDEEGNPIEEAGAENNASAEVGNPPDEVMPF
jgi:single-strand DNA-binding protein